MNYTDEEMVLFATALAMELAKGMSEKEIKFFLVFLSQMSCSLTSLLGEREKK